MDDSLPRTGAEGRASALVTLGARVLVSRDAGPEVALTGKAALVVAIVGMEGSVERRRAARLLWPESDEVQARNNLRTLVHRLNRRLGAELVAGADRLSMDHALVRLPLQESEVVLSALETGGRRDCELLSDAEVDADAGEALEAWLQSARQRLRRLQLQHLCEALARAEADGDPGRATALARACVQLEPFSEHWHRQLMNTLARFGDRAAALAAYEELKTLLRQHLGASPDVQTRTVQLRILQGEAGDPRTGVPAELPATPMTAGLTPLGGAARYELVEREEVLAQMGAALAAGLHVALQGEAGVGKTRLLRHLGESAQGCEQLAFQPGARDEPYAAVAQLLQEVQPRRGARVAVADQIELARMAPLAFPDVQAPPTRLLAARLQEALRHWLQALGEVGVKRLVLDDLHYADAASQAALAAMLAPAKDGRGPSPTLLLAHRSGEIGDVLREALVDAQVHGHATCIALQRLTLGGVRSLLRAVGLDASEAERHLERTGGNPLFVIELAEHAREQGEGRKSANLDALLVSRLRGCSAQAQQLAAVAAVAGQEFSVELAASVTGQAPLALMPAWSELQQRGLFADHGLAHDLVREAVLGSLPGAIGCTLHGQLAAWLEAQGTKGAAVLRHWLAAGSPDRALPHAEHQLHVTSAAGLSTLQLELDLLDLLARVSDRVLLDNLWLTAEAGSSFTANFALPEVWPRLAGLLARVRSMPGADAATGWVMYESARQAYHVERSVKAALDFMSEASRHVPPKGIARAHVEHQLAFYHDVTSGNGRENTRRALEALEALPPHLHLRRARLKLQEMVMDTLSVVSLLRRHAAEMKAARRRGDQPGAVEARVKIAMTHYYNGSNRHGFRHLERATRQSDAGDQDHVERQPALGILALKLGRFDDALRCFHEARDASFVLARPAFLALTWLRLGDAHRAAEHALEIRPERVRHAFITMMVSAHVRVGLDAFNGTDPLPAMRKAYDDMADLGIDGGNLALMSWEIALLAKPAAARWAEGQDLLAMLRAESRRPSHLVRPLIGLAEAAAEIGEPSGPLARQAARLLRREWCSMLDYVPDGLVRCADLLRATDPAEAASLMHVARRWVLEALRHVPPEAVDGFRAVPVNRRLLASGPDA